MDVFYFDIALLEQIIKRGLKEVVVKHEVVSAAHFVGLKINVSKKKSWGFKLKILWIGA